VQLLKQIFEWFDEMDDLSSRVFSLNGLAGTGKTTVARSVADLADDQHRLAATFFFSRNNAVTRDAAALLPTIVYQFAGRHTVFRSLSCTAIKSDTDVRDREIARQANILLGNFVNATALPLQLLLIVIDALDECDPGKDDEGINALRILINTVASLSSFKIFVTSRVERNIVDMFAPLRVSKLALHCDIEDHIVQSDIRTYFQHEFTELAHSRQLDFPFPSPEALDELVNRAGTLFIYAATVFKYIADRQDSPVLRLYQVSEQTLTEVPYQYKALDMVYSRVISEAATTSGNPETHARNLRCIISALIGLQESLPILALAGLAGISSEVAEIILQRLSSILMVEKDAPIRLYHPSFVDFITDFERCPGENHRFVVIPSEVHTYLAHQCLKIMNGHLRRDICDIKDPSLLNCEVLDLENRLALAAPCQLRYACRFWLAHLHLCGKPSEGVLVQLAFFTKKNILHWVELLSLMGELFVVQRSTLPLIAYLRVRDRLYCSRCHS
jgi:hypothetical protein